MGDDSDNTGHLAAQAMLDSFASVGATHFDVTWTNAAGDKQHFRRNVSLAEFRRALPARLDEAILQQRNLIVRPHGPGVTFVQLDDLKAERLAAVAPVVFLALETSPGNYQAWVALPGDEDKDLARRLRKGTGADTTASGATRVAGSMNFKDKYAPNFPRVTIHAAQLGRTATADELDRLGLVAAPEIVAQPLRTAPPVFPPAIAAGRAMRGVLRARRSTARTTGQTAAGPILCGA
jgi:RepB DNA-primase from phage plasmid